MSTWYLSHSNSYNFQSLLYQPLKNSKLWTKHHIILPHDQQQKPVSSFEQIKSADLVIAEVSESKTGIGIELGWAHALHKPIICFHQKGTTPSGSLQFMAKKIFSYSSTGNLIKQLGQI